ncbi:MAG: hypothetical protein AB1489_24610 [Acidobacteriota bacterium]
MADKSFLDPLHVLNTRIRNINAPAPPVPKWFIKELEDIGGKTPKKQPKLRIVWGGSEIAWSKGRIRIKYPKFTKKFPIGWEVIRQTQDGEIRELLPMETINEEDKRIGRIVYDWIDIGQPRFFIERWLPPEVACKGWPADGDMSQNAVSIRYAYDPEIGWIDVIGPQPKDGLYLEWLKLETASGQFQAPDEEVMAAIRREHFLLRRQPHLWSPGDRPPSWLIEQRLRDRYDQVEQNEENFINNIADDILQHMRLSYRAALDDKILFLPK